MAQTDFPKYLLIINGKEKFLCLKQAAEAYDSDIGRVSVGTYVLAEDFTVRRLEDADTKLISNAADKYRSKK